MPAPLAEFPRIASVGLTGLLVQFADHLSEPANRAAIAFRAALERESWPGVEETSSSLASAFVRFDPLAINHCAMRAQVTSLLAENDWYAAPLPGGGGCTEFRASLAAAMARNLTMQLRQRGCRQRRRWHR